MKPSIVPVTNFNFTCIKYCTCSDENNCHPYTLWGNAAQQCFVNDNILQTTECIINYRQHRDESVEDILISLLKSLY